ncbi:hypothetical protein AB0L97_36980 [Nocardia sp. NPDC051911]
MPSDTMAGRSAARYATSSGAYSTSCPNDQPRADNVHAVAEVADQHRE